MFAWLSSKVPIYASGLFRGTWPLRKDGFDFLQQQGIDLSDGPENENAHWSLKLRHPAWGEATLINLRSLPMPPHSAVEWDANLTPDEVGEIKSCGTGVSLHMESARGHILRDRKGALCFLNAILGDDGVAALDHVAQKFWSRTALELEAAHQADLDVDGIMSYHAVTADKDSSGSEQVVWLHTHGLGEIGYFDFDILRPCQEMSVAGLDFLRSIAFQILEGKIEPGGTYEPISGRPAIRFVKAADFMANAEPADRALRSDPNNEHVEKRVVLCEGASGLLGKFFGDKPRPAGQLSEPFDPNTLLHFTSDASALMAERAKATFKVFTDAAKELAEFELGGMVKLAYRIDNGKENDNEHLWFEYHGAEGAQIDATLRNQPFQIAAMNEGQRGWHSLERLSDWGIFTPAGLISPRSTKPLRLIRQHKDELRTAFKEEKEQSTESLDS